MNKLRDRLRTEAPELCAALERSWEIARNEWLPALGAKNDSYNSYPHLRNLETYLDQVIFGFEPLALDRKKAFISATEIYVILSAILFHDIGYIKAEKKEDTAKGGTVTTLTQEEIIKEQHKTSHPYQSMLIVKNEWNDLGICSIELAKSIGKICAYHDCDENRTRDKEEDLVNVIVDPYGEVREKWLGCLLVLVDHMDGAYTRVLPQYIRSGRPMKIVGAFRNVISGVYLDPHKQMIRTVLSESLFEKKVSTIEPVYVYSRNKKLETKQTEIINVIKGIHFENKDSPLDIEKIIKNEKVKKLIADYSFTSPLIEKLTGSRFLEPDWLIMWHFLFVEIGNDDAEWTPNKLLAMVISDVVINKNSLNLIKNELAANGVRIKDWVIDYEEHLYTDQGIETIEPIFSWSYLSRVIKSMLKLSSTILNPGYFSYKTLASDVREPNLERLKVAVRRICILLEEEDKTTSDSDKLLIWAGEDHWKWKRVSSRNNQQEEKYVDDKIIKLEKLANTNFARVED